MIFKNLMLLFIAVTLLHQKDSIALDIPLLLPPSENSIIQQEVVSEKSYANFLNQSLNQSIKRKFQKKSKNKNYTLDTVVIALGVDVRAGLLGLLKLTSGGNFEFHLKVMD